VAITEYSNISRYMQPIAAMSMPCNVLQIDEYARIV